MNKRIFRYCYVKDTTVTTWNFSFNVDILCYVSQVVERFVKRRGHHHFVIMAAMSRWKLIVIFGVISMFIANDFCLAVGMWTLASFNPTQFNPFLHYQWNTNFTFKLVKRSYKGQLEYFVIFFESLQSNLKEIFSKLFSKFIFRKLFYFFVDCMTRVFNMISWYI